MHDMNKHTAAAKNRITVTLDQDVVDKVLDIAQAQRLSVSSLINRVVAEKLGLIPENNIWSH